MTLSSEWWSGISPGTDMLWDRAIRDVTSGRSVLLITERATYPAGAYVIRVSVDVDAVCFSGAEKNVTTSDLSSESFWNQYHESQFDVVLCDVVVAKVANPEILCNNLRRIGLEGVIEYPTVVGELLDAGIGSRWVVEYDVSSGVLIFASLNDRIRGCLSVKSSDVGESVSHYKFHRQCLVWRVGFIVAKIALRDADMLAYLMFKVTLFDLRFQAEVHESELRDPSGVVPRLTFDRLQHGERTKYFESVRPFLIGLRSECESGTATHIACPDANRPSGQKERCKIAVFMHIPKTAGSSLVATIELNYESEEILEANTDYDVYSKITIAAESVRANAKLIRGHRYFGAFGELWGDPQYFTLLREPAARFVSELVFARTMPDHVLRPIVKNMQVRDMLQLDFVDYVMTEHASQFDNPYVRYFAGEDDDNVVKLLPLAEVNRRKFEFVGVTEQFDACIHSLSKIFRWTRMSNANLNVGDRVVVQPTVLAEVQRRLQYDYEIYASALRVRS